MTPSLLLTNGSRYSRMDQIKFWKIAFKKFEVIWSASKIFTWSVLEYLDPKVFNPFPANVLFYTSLKGQQATGIDIKNWPEMPLSHSLASQNLPICFQALIKASARREKLDPNFHSFFFHVNLQCLKKIYENL